MKSLKNFRYLNGSSIVESIIATVLISICSLISFYVYINVIKQKQPLNLFKARHQIEVITANVEKQQDFDNETFTFKNYSINKTALIDAEQNVVILKYKVIMGKKNYLIKKLVKFEN